MQRCLKYYLFLLLATTIASCHKEAAAPESPDAAFISFKIKGYHQDINMAPLANFIRIRVDDTVTNATSLIAEFTTSTGARTYVNNVSQQSGITTNDFEGDIAYNILAQNRITSKQWTISVTNNNYSQDWGLGNILKKTYNNNKPQLTYLDQKETGTFSDVNCGPTVTTMAIKWANPAFTKTPADARNTYLQGGGWWFTSNITSYMNDNGINNVVIPLSPNDPVDSWNKIVRQLEYGRMVIVCLDMNIVTYSPDLYKRTDKFYQTTPGFGHFLLIKGYRNVDKQHFFEVYDPNSWGRKYDDGSYKGKDRYYRYQDIVAATANWWPYAIVVAPLGETITAGTYRNAVNPSQIPDARGR